MSGGEGHLQDIYKLLDCQIITAVPFGPDSVYCDDEGLTKEPVYQFFGIKGVAQPLAGRGLVIGLDADGNDATPSMTLEDVQAQTFFVERLFRDLWGVREAERLHHCEIGPLEYVTSRLSGELAT